jgi:PTS system nitrogen regulatory IIA component
MAVGISKTDIIDFQTIDDVPVKLLIMIAAAYNQHSYYLQTLSFFSSRLKNQELRDALLSTTSAKAAFDLLVQE